MVFLAGILGGCIKINADTNVKGTDKYSAIGEKYADKYAENGKSAPKSDDDWATLISSIVLIGPIFLCPLSDIKKIPPHTDNQ